MKKLKYILFIFSLIALASCKKDLNEIPLDFYSPENSYTDKAQFEAALANIYLDIRSYFYANRDASANYDMLGIDCDFTDNGGGGTVSSYFNWNTFNADAPFADKWWQRLYRLIAESNAIIDRADLPAAVWASEADKNAIVGEAKFLRAFAYRFLGNMWGGVPLVLTKPNHQSLITQGLVN